MGVSRILIVDDDPQIRRVMITTLTSQEYEVATAATGEEALLAFREHRCDLILLDVNMPGMGGIEACRKIRAGSDVAIIMLTVRDAESDKVEALDAGADDYVIKPFSMPELLARIRATLRRSPFAPESSPSIIQAGRISIDVKTREATVDGNPVRLTPTEFNLLRYFVTHPNESLTHTRLLQAVWGPDYGYQVEYLRVFVKQLRKKLEKNPTEPRYFLTEPWIGYRFHLPS